MTADAHSPPPRDTQSGAGASDYDTIRLVFEGDIARITLARPDHLNPLDWGTIRELNSAVDAIAGQEGIRFVTIIGAGRSFSAGGDLDAYVRLYDRPSDFAAFLEDFRRLLAAIEAAPQVFVALVNGVCVAGGLELLLACDLALAAEDARIGDAHLNFGQLPGAGGSQRLPRAIGLIRAKHLILTGELITAARAEQIGLVNAVVPATDLGDAASSLIAKLRDKSPTGLAGAKHLANLGLTEDFETALASEIAFVHRYATTDADAREGLVAFREKRAPRFGRGSKDKR